MFNFIRDTVRLPMSVAADVLTLGGSLNEKAEPYTVKNLRDIFEDLGG